MTGTFFQCDACGRLEKDPYLDEGLPVNWISIKLRVPDWYEFTGFYMKEFHICSHECAHKLIEAKKADVEKYKEETRPKKPIL